MRRGVRTPPAVERELGRAQSIILETVVDPPPDPFGERAVRHAKRLIITVIGLTVLLLGLAMIVLPGPAFLVVPLGLLILASEYVWARRMLARVRAGVAAARSRVSAPRKRAP